MKIWFTSDTHFGHANIIKYCKRPFDTLKEMNETIIKNWNDRVDKEEFVFHMGDFCFKNSNEIRGEGVREKASHWLSKLNGNIIVVKGNHDRTNSINTPIQRMELYYGGKNILLIHDSKDTTKEDFKKFKLIFCGHVHAAWKFQRVRGYPNVTIINVGVDVWNFRPISYPEISKQLVRFLRENKSKGKV